MGEALHKKYINSEITEIAETFSKLYEGAGGFIKIMSGNNRRGYFYSKEVLCDEIKLEAILESRRFSIDNVYASMATYKTMKEATMGNILTVNALAIDADFTLQNGQENITTEEAINALHLAVLDGFPEPTYIEFSRNLRLVYIFEKPYIIPQNREKAEACRTFLKRVAICLSEELNRHSEVIYFNATPQRLTSFIRIPHSVNKRTYGHYDYDRKVFVIDVVNRYEVDIKQFGDKWDIEKLSELVLPPLFSGYKEWKQKNRQKKQNKVTYIKPQGIAEKRLTELEELQRRGYDVGYREKLCYFYWVTVRQAGKTEEEATEAVKAYNSQFKIPLEEHRLLTDCKLSKYIDGRSGKQCEGWERHFKDSTIREQLGLGVAEADLFGGKGMTEAERARNYRKRKRAEAEIAGNTKQKQIEQHVEEVKRMREAGMKWKEIADSLGVSERTARKYGERLKKQNEQ